MNIKMLIAVLGATITLSSPSVSLADNGYKFKDSSAERNHQHKHKQRVRHNHKNNKVVVKSAKKPRFVKQTKRDIKNKNAHNKNNRKQQYSKQRSDQYNKRRNAKQHNSKRHDYKKDNYRKNDQSFSITWNAGNSSIIYDNSYSKNHYNERHIIKNTGAQIYNRINLQTNSIRNGINNGQLVKREVKQLRHEQQNIKKIMSQFKHDSHFNRYERSKLNHLLDVASNNINHKTNNRLTRYTQKQKRDHYVQF